MPAAGFTYYAANGLLLLVPVLSWNALFWTKLPPAFAPKEFDRNIPTFVTLGENSLRILVFALPAFMPLQLDLAGQAAAWLVYLGGLVVYFCSWLPLVFRPRSGWSQSLAGFLAPGYTPLGFFAGIAMLGRSFYFSIPYSPWFYLLAVAGFLGFHLRHLYLVYRRIHQAAAEAV